MDQFKEQLGKYGMRDDVQHDNNDVRVYACARDKKV